ncbi:MAG: SMC-Scp complex subunit ScpB [Verrucomicrobiales bacterium]|jgi:segregation and condensation protein B|nr:SMC-Scp complex subunit ScpB [Verrucomicrobiales bacterium]
MLELIRIVETILFTANKPLKLEELTRLVRQGAAEDATARDFAAAGEAQVLEAIERLRVALEPRGLVVQELAGGFRMATREMYAPWVRAMFEVARAPRLSQPALETLAIVAYRQPISRAEIEAVRGVAAGGVLETLVDRGIVRVAGRADVPGRPLIYETTEFFLEHFGLRDLNDLPNVEELKRVKLPEAKKTPEGQAEFIDANGKVATVSGEDGEAAQPGPPAPAAEPAADDEPAPHDADLTGTDETEANEELEDHEERHDEPGSVAPEN